MRLFIFKSESGALSAFAGDSDARVLPTQHGPWHPIGVVRPDADPPHNFKRAAIEKAIADQGYQLFRLKKKPAPSLVSKI
ncbi:MAG: hypothetical protein ABWY64_15595 [Tardiphaga sp.]|jgi:hypothetical protein